MVFYVKNTFNPVDNKKYLKVWRRWQKSGLYITVYPGKTSDPIELPDIDDTIEISIAPHSPDKDVQRISRITYDEVIQDRLDITPPSVMIDYPVGVRIKGDRRKVSIYPERNDWHVLITHPGKDVDRWTLGMKPGEYPETVTVVIGEDVDEEE
ncbi:MAG TPA: hypothetical protein VK186_11505 [Candidatus Deferrimicrobium sp.]|nr:hypothetical protein [Candidatus Deferrimicrobium sp.]